MGVYKNNIQPFFLATRNLAAIDSAYTRGGSSASTVMGAKTFFQLKNGGGTAANWRVGFVKFPPGLEGTVVLRFTYEMNATENGTVVLYACDSNWNSNTITYNNMPARGVELGRFLVPLTALAGTGFDVAVTLPQGVSSVRMEMDNTTEPSFQFAGYTSATPPLLTV